MNMDCNKIQKILFVDDEKQVLNSLERVLMDYDYEIFTAEGGKEALEILGEEEDIDLIVSDMRMPYMDGYELLKQVKQKYPNIIRILLSGYADEYTINKALQENVAKICFSKPWDSSYLLKESEHIYKTELTIKSDEIYDTANNIYKSLNLDNDYYKFIEFLGSSIDIKQIANYIPNNISKTMLYVVNSISFDKNYDTVEEALNYIGSQNLYVFLKAIYIGEMIRANIKSDLIIEIFKNSFVTTKIYNLINSKYLNDKILNNYSFSMFLYNIGIVALINTYPDIVANKDLTITLEKNVFPVNPQKVGACLLEILDFPYQIVETALYYNDPFNELIVNSKSLSLLYIAQNCTYKNNDFNLKAFDILKLNKQKFFTAVEGLVN